MEAKLSQPLLIKGKEWPTGTILRDYEFDNSYKHCATFPDGEWIAFIPPDFIIED